MCRRLIYTEKKILKHIIKYFWTSGLLDTGEIQEPRNIESVQNNKATDYPDKIKPTHEQQNILNCTGRVIKINARAGTGKTETLLLIANKFKSEIKVSNLSTGSNDVNAKSILRILSLGVYSGHTIRVCAEGEDEAQAIEELKALVDQNFA